MKFAITRIAALLQHDGGAGGGGGVWLLLLLLLLYDAAGKTIRDFNFTETLYSVIKFYVRIERDNDNRCAHVYQHFVFNNTPDDDDDDVRLHAKRISRTAIIVAA